MNIDTSLPLHVPSWSVPANIKAYITLRYPGKSTGKYQAFNLALHTGDHLDHVLQNRRDLVHDAHLPELPRWLNQTHSNIALRAETISPHIPPTGDASFTHKKEIVCVVMTADCLPILVTNTQGTEVAAIHAGWQGLAQGIVESTLSQLSSASSSLLVWIGPSIQQPYYEVGKDFYETFAKNHDAQEMSAAFSQQTPDKWLANVALLAVQRLMRMGVAEKNIYLSHECTYAHAEKYFSYRRDGVTGRMASLIWME